MARSTLPRTVLALALVSLLTDASSEMIFPLIPTYLAITLGAGARWVGLIEGAAELVAAVLKFVSGKWSDRLPRRKPLVVFGYGIASVLRPLVGLTSSAAQVLFIRLGDRVGKGVRSAPRDALIADAVDPAQRGRAFSTHRAADHFGAVLGPLMAYALLRWAHVELRTVFLLAAIPAALAMVALIVGVRESPRGVEPVRAERTIGDALPPVYFRYLGVLLLFTLGNSTDAFLLLRAGEVGISTATIPLLWAWLHVVKTVTSIPGGVLSDRIGRTPLIVAGWLVYALVYLAFGRATAAWQIWALFAAYGTFYGLTEGVEKAFVADLVPQSSRGRAFGWYNMTLGLGALPSALLFGALYDRFGAVFAFTFGAAMAAAAAILLVPMTRKPPLAPAKAAG